MADIKINRKLNLTIDWETETKGTIHIYSTPIPKAVFDDNYLLFARSYSALYSNDLGAISGPRIAAQLLRQQAIETNQADKYEKLVMEIRRLTNVLVPASNGTAGYEVIPYFELTKRKIIDEDDASEIESAIIFFMLVLWMTPKPRLAIILGGLSLIWPAATTSLTLSDYQRSLRTSMKEEDTGPKPTQPVSQASSFPS